MMQPFAEAATQVFVAFGNAATEAGKSLRAYGKYLYSISMDAYLDAGRPYGKTRRGFKKWQNEQIANRQKHQTPIQPPHTAP